MKLRVREATDADIPQWLDLAGENGALFGADMAHDSEFRTALHRNVTRGSAFCVHIDGELAGAMLFRNGWIQWLAVRKRFRRRGVGRALVEHAISSGQHEVWVTTFGDSHPHPDAHAARELYRSMGFTRSEVPPAAAPDGTPRIVLVWSTRRLKHAKELWLQTQLGAIGRLSRGEGLLRAQQTVTP